MQIPPAESQLQLDVDAIKKRVVETQSLYRETCVLMFFYYGITPTANKLYQLVRRGSMSAPSQALAKFWSDLREKSRVRIEGPDLPIDVRNLAGELVGALWKKAQLESQSTVKHLEIEAKKSVEDANARIMRSLQEQAVLDEKNCSQNKIILDLQGKLRDCEISLVATQSKVASLNDQLMCAHQEKSKLQNAQDNARHEFSAELDKFRAASTYADKRAQESEKRALLEIDRERTIASKLQKNLIIQKNDYESKLTIINKSHKENLDKLAELQQKVLQLETLAQAEKIRKEETVIAIQELQSSEQKNKTSLALMRVENSRLKSQLAKLHKSMGTPRKIRRNALPLKNLFANLKRQG